MKNSLLFLLLLFFISPSFSQEKKFEFGLNGGTNLLYTDFATHDGMEKATPSLGWNTGIEFQFHFQNAFLFL
jgi:hypothetical protein